MLAPGMVRNYLRANFLSDLKAGFITSVVALPLAIAFAVASGVPAVMGLYTAIIAGVLGSAFGGSRFSITGPTGAMTVIILSTVTKFGIEGLVLAGMLAGLMQILFGVLRIGNYVKYIPLPVVSGFTAGIGLIIFIGQIGNAFGLQLAAHDFVGATLRDILENLHAINLSALLIAAGTIVLLWLLPGLFRRLGPLRAFPPSLVPLVFSVAAVTGLSLVVPQVGDIPHGLPLPHLVNFNLELARNVLPSALTIALLGAIEALLCAVVADGMTGTRHYSDRELKAQGITNTVLPFFGGIPATAAIARTAVNIREGAKTQGAGIIHALFLLSFMLLFSSLVGQIPKAFLAGILMYVSVRMINLGEIRTVLRISRQESIVLFVTMGLTLFTDLVFAVQVGMMLAIFMLFVRIVGVTDISVMEEYDPSDTVNALVNESPELRNQLAVYTINGPFFFGAMSVFEQKLDEHKSERKPFILLRMKHVPFIDATGQTRLKEFIRHAQSRGTLVLLSSLQPKVAQQLLASPEFRRLLPGEQIFDRSIQAVLYAQEKITALSHSGRPA